MATAIGDLVVRLGMSSGPFDKTIRGSTSSLRTFASVGAAAGAAASLVTGAIGLAVRSFRRFGAAGSEFNAAMRESMAIMSGVSAEVESQMRATAFAAARETGQAASEMAKSYYYLTSAGLDAQQSIAALPQVARFAKAGMFDMSTATSMASDAQSAMGLRSKDAAANLGNLARVTDVLVGANILANASTEQFADALTSGAGAAARTVGKDIEETVAVLAALADQGFKGADASTVFEMALRDLQTKAIQFKGVFAKEGIKVFDDAGEMRHMADIVGDLEKKLLPLSDMAKKKMLLDLGFSDKSIKAIQVMLGTSDKIRRYNQELDNMGGITAKVADKQLGEMSKGFNTLKVSLTEASAYIMKIFGPSLGSLFTGLAKIVTVARVAGVTLVQAFAESVSGIAELSVMLWNSFRPLSDGAASAFQTVVANLDVMLGSVEGWKSGLVNIFYQTVYAFEAIWEQAKNHFLTTWEGIGGWWGTFWLDMQKSMVTNLLPGFARVGLEIQKALTKATGGEWNMTAEQEALFVNVAQQAALADLSKKRQEMETATNGRLEALRAQHEAAMSGIGEKSLAQSEKWAKQMGTLPTVSGAVADAWKTLGAAPAAGESAAATAAAATDEGGVSTSKYSGAMEKGTAEAYSTIVNAGKESDKIAKQQLTVEKGMAADMKIVASRFGNTSTVSIPV